VSQTPDEIARKASETSKPRGATSLILSSLWLPTEALDVLEARIAAFVTAERARATAAEAALRVAEGTIRILEAQADGNSDPLWERAQAAEAALEKAREALRRVREEGGDLVAVDLALGDDNG
jgi:hypothetical protein